MWLLVCCVSLLLAALPSAVLAAGPAPAESRGLVGPIILLIVIVLLNAFALSFAFRLRRYFRELADQGDDE
ncbi:MAG: hypothetical protein H7Z42_08480 [Roseiflexaceae bacterium]|nr:hypothetical protein [Roseiflexaceae bacterium]